ncbi:hypothetical protein G3R49_02240 [Shewanella sp. WXL01]|uniref:hypothetical protein n=1 Tax=Shewanella sp. WXL01 TaxID=2709721 RepID=UPI00143841F5|nr:hypothetical protein [Shewanella sp. WXL01]NKF49401.1 hypothetical protein [Shewanella sp. WXL01]
MKQESGVGNADAVALDDKRWFFDFRIKGMSKFNDNSIVKLAISRLFYPLPLISSLLILFVMLGVAAAPLSIADDELARTFALANFALVPIYFIVRWVLIRLHYGSKLAQQCIVSRDKLILPGSAIINKPKGEYVIEREHIKRAKVIYKSRHARAFGVRNHIVGIEFILQSGEKVYLDALYFPLKQLFYMLLFFDYPVRTVHGQYSFKSLLAIVFTAFPVLASMVICAAVVESFL